MENQSHLSEEQLEQYVRGQLNFSDVAPLEEHLIVCAACQDRLDEAENFAVGMQRALSESPAQSPAPRGARSWFDWLRRPAFSMALGFAALILVVAIFSNTANTIAPTASLVLSAVRGEMPQTVPARQFELTLRDTPKEGGPFRAELVTAAGGPVWSGLVVPGPNGVQVTEPRRLDVGDYFLRLSNADGKLLHEYGFRVRR